MSETKPPRELDALIGDAFAERGELPPTTVAEVERAEADGVEHEGELPESLVEYRPPATDVHSARGDRVISLDERRNRSRGLATHAIAVVVGFAAAAALFVWRERTDSVGGTSASSEPPVPTADATPPPTRIAIGPVRSCDTPCCAGARCKDAKPELRQCSSGRECVACSFEALAQDRYRVNLSAFAPEDPARKLLEPGRGTALDLCVQLGSSEVRCVPAHAQGDSGQPWSRLPLVASAQDLLGGFLLQVRVRGSNQALAEWRGPVRLNPTLLCKGLLLKPKTPKDEVFGTVSAFLEDTHYVELARDNDAKTLEELAARFDLADVKLAIVETSGSGRNRLALRAGPLSKSAAEKLRYQLELQKQTAPLVTGDDQLSVLTKLP